MSVTAPVRKASLKRKLEPRKEEVGDEVSEDDEDVALSTEVPAPGC